jgi:hypothetical protein
VTIELSPERLYAIVMSEKGLLLFDSMITMGYFSLDGEKVSLVNRRPNIQWQVDYWRAQHENEEHDATRRMQWQKT